MVEVVFVIVIIGILSAIAIPKLAATRDDAQASVVLEDLSTCIMDGGGSYTARQKLSLSSASCQKALKCFDIVMGNNDEGNGSLIVMSGSGVGQASDRNKQYCQKAYSVADSHGLSSPSGKEHRFGGTNVSF
jgi:type II secretory pathway pseudopilin PulG